MKLMKADEHDVECVLVSVQLVRKWICYNHAADGGLRGADTRAYIRSMEPYTPFGSKIMQMDFHTHTRAHTVALKR